jgi:hypothetical protein
MIIKVNNRMRFMPARLHGGKATEKQIIRLHNEGWYPANIASIAQANIATVREVLKRRNLITD